MPGFDAIKADTAVPTAVPGAVKCIAPFMTVAIPGEYQVSVPPVS